MSNRRGIALLAALWFVVAIATVGLAFGLEAREHRAIGMTAADRVTASAAATGGLALARARLERAMRQLPRTNGSAISQLRASDPWLDADSLFPDPLLIGNLVVHVHAEDLQAKLNINAMQLPELRMFLGFVLQNYEMADGLAQAIEDWRDRDDLVQMHGAERDAYLAHQALDLPGNRGSFYDIDGLRSVQGMTPEIMDRIRPYLRVQGNPGINVNTAPAVVLRAVPGMTDATITRILSIRSQRRRINALTDLGIPEEQQAVFGQSLVFEATQLALTVTVDLPPPARAVQQVWMVEKNGNQAGVRWTDGAY